MTTKKTGYIVLGGLALIAGTAWYFYRQGQKKPTIAGLPTDTQAGGGSSSIPSDNARIESISERIYRDGAGFNVFANHDEQPYQDALALSNTDFVQLYNIWNSLHQAEFSETLKGFINDQWSVPYSPFATIKESILQRMDTLDLA